MEEFTPIAMKCTQEQFDAVRPKLKDLNIIHIEPFTDCNYLVNNLWGKEKTISNITNPSKGDINREIHEEWNEEIFLKACGIETETLQEKEQRLLEELEEVRKEIEDSEIKVGDVCKFWNDNKNSFVIGVVQHVCENTKLKYETIFDCQFPNAEKITNPELIKLLEKEIK